jgi:HD-GYP domain-containing protein (c-di-GMP phosphodiesterase class II)
VLALNAAYRGTALLLGDVVEADHKYTGAHSRDVVRLSIAVADLLNIETEQRSMVEFAALLHDVGKIRLPKQILDKPAALTPAERELIEQHTIWGEQMLSGVGGMLADVGRVVRSCHEWWDGGGYPDGLTGAAIPIAARIVCTCDALSAMTTDRPYRKARSVHDALKELDRCAGTQFDPAVVRALKSVVESNLASPPDHRLAA